MSIQEPDGKEIVTLGSVHSAVFKASLYVMPLVLGYFVTMVVRHDREIAVLQAQVAARVAAQVSVKATPNLADNK